MKLTITTLVIIEDITDLSVPERSICYHSFFEDIEKAKKEIIDDVNQVCSVDKIPLANFLNDDQGYESGISMYGHYIACKCLDISSEEEYMNQLTDIRILTNELEPC